MYSYIKTVPDSVPMPPRIVVVPDVHRDLAKARQCLVLAGVIDGADAWVAVPRNTVVVQVGDQVDGAVRSEAPARRPHECGRALAEDLEVLCFFNRLHVRASAVGGVVYGMLGNHEVMNHLGDFRYADTEGCAACERQREVAFRAGGPAARILACTRAVVLRVGPVLFCHAGLLPLHLAALEGWAGVSLLNSLMTAALLGNPVPAAAHRKLMELAMGEDGVLTTRAFQPAKVTASREGTEAVLRALGAECMVVGYNAHAAGVTPIFGGRVWVADGGMSFAIMDGRPTVLLISPAPGSSDLLFRTLRG